MGKRKSGRGTAVDYSENSPAHSDSDGSEKLPPKKKTKSDSSTPKSSSQRSSEELAVSFGLTHVDLEWTEADYQNLTNYGLFVRMVRPQVQGANPSINAGKLSQLMEAYWKEFKEGNPAAKKKKEEEERRKEEKAVKAEEKRRRQEEEEEERKQHVIDSEPEIDDEEDEEIEDEPISDDDDAASSDHSGRAAKKSTPKRGGLMRVKLALPKSSSAKKGRRSQTNSNYTSDDDTPRRKSKAKKARPAIVESEDEDSEPKSRSKKKPRKSEVYEEEDFGARRSGRAVKKKQIPDYADLSDEDDSDERPAPAKKSRAKKKKVEVSDDDFEAVESDEPEQEDEPIDSDDEDVDSDGGKWPAHWDKKEGGRKKRKRSSKKKSRNPSPEDFRIPGERKSSRKGMTASKSSLKNSMMSDREFERMLKQQSEAEEKKEAKKKDKKKKLAEKEKRKESNREKKDRWIEKMERKKEKQEKKEEDDDDADSQSDSDDDDSGNESDHCFYCDVCWDAGDLMLCDKCPRAYHKECLKLEEVPEGDWDCPKCTGEMESEEEDTGHESFCRHCKDGGDVLLCDTCPCVFHMHCLIPRLKEIPDGEWRCPRCVTMDTPLKGWVEKCITWRWSTQDEDFDAFDHSHRVSGESGGEKQGPTKKATDKMRKELEDKKKDENELPPIPQRLLFVKFKDYSFWECDWITELQYEMFHPTSHAHWRKKWDLDEPPALEDGSSFGKKREKAESQDKENSDPYDLNEKYYKWGVKPEYMQVERIVNHDRKKLFLVKWKELGYEDCTWEDANKMHPGVEDWQKKVDAYWSRRKEHMKDKVDKGPKPKKSHLKKKWEKQPDYVDATGCKLHPYQLEGLNWLRFSWAQDTNTILADEMGLGKTIQGVTFLYSLWKEGYTKGPFLLSVPLSTLLNWEREFQIWAPDMYVVTYIGQKDARPIIREHEFSYKEGCFSSYSKPCRFSSAHKPKFDVLLTSYEYVNMDCTTLSSIRWSVLIIDEAHRLKSQQSLFFRTLSGYKIDYRLLLTGTPLQNNLEELFNLLNFLEKEKFSNMEEFLSIFTDISKEDQVSTLHEMLAPHMLRRLKIDVFKDLPSKTELIVRVELSAMQKKFYKHILTKNYEALNVKGHNNQTSLMNIMMDLRKCCNHPYMFPTAEQDAPLNRNGMYEVNGMIKASGKLDILDKMLKHLKEQGHRVLIFSQMTKVLDLLEDFMHGSNYHYERIDGSIMGKFRQQAIDRFNNKDSDSFVFLLSTRSGGLGINLATADTVIIFDMDWNPHNDIQAFSRAHRIGQKNKVMIYRFVCRNTVEEKMTQVCKQKMMLTELVIHRNVGGVTKDKTESISKKEVNDILKFGAEKLFDDDAEGKVTYDDKTILRLLDRDQGDEEAKPTEEGEPSFGMNDYLRSFKVASYNMKDTGDDDEDEEEEEKKEEEAAEEEKNAGLGAPEDDPEYWQRLLGSAFEEHQLQLLQEQEALAASLGKGKRTRKKVNYAEALREEARIREKEAKRQAEEDAGDDDDKEDREDVLYMSDYEPTDSDSEAESGSGGEEQGEEEAEVLKDQPKVYSKAELAKMSKVERNKLKAEEKEREKARLAKEAEKKMPPLLARVNGQIEEENRSRLHKWDPNWVPIKGKKKTGERDENAEYDSALSHAERLEKRLRDAERELNRKLNEKYGLDGSIPFPEDVLGFTPRQRRAFMDAVMRFGMPLEDIYKSQWLVRDLRRKPEKVFRAYVSLFMRHLCEPISDDAEKFSDGIPREGLSRQHILTRVGMMSLIRRKVHEFEKHNGIDSFTDFGIKIIVGGSKAELVLPKKDGEKSKDTSRASSVEKETVDLSKDKDEVEIDLSKDSPKKDEKEGEDKDKSENKEKEKSVDKEDEKEGKKDGAEDENKAKEKANKDEEARDKPDDKEDKAEDKKEGEKAAEDVEMKDDETGESEAAQRNTETGEVEKKKAEEKMEVDEESGENKKKEEGDEKKEEKEENKKEDEEKSSKEKEESEKEENESKKEEEESKKEEEKESSKGEDKEEEKEKSEKKVEKEGSPDKEGKDEEKKKDSADGKKTAEDEKDKSDDKKDEKSDKKDEKSDEQKKKDKEEAKKEKKSKVEKAIEERQSRQKRLRKKFYIADGGFTDLQNLWNYEENLMKDQEEFEVWHRHHDFWLLAGIITHGYRHWQDILNDPRFESLNRAFRNDSDKMRKGAFLNRRFQLLEQALVIEEQLRRELRENESLLKLLPEPKDADDIFTQIDQLAEVLRKLIKDGHIPAGTDPVLIKILMQIENLVGDIRQSTYTGMPSTIAKAPPQPNQPGQQQQPQRPGGATAATYPRGTVASQIQLQQQQKQRQQDLIRKQQAAGLGKSPQQAALGKSPLQAAALGKSPEPSGKKKGNVIEID